MNQIRIIEILVGTAVTILAGYLLLVPVIEERLNRFGEDVTDLKSEVRTMRGELHGAKVQIGDRWTKTEHLQYERLHNDKHSLEWSEHRKDKHE